MADDIQAQLKAAASGSAPAQKSSGDSVLQKQLINIQQEIAEKNIAREAKEQGLNYVSLLSIPLKSDVLRILTREEMREGKMAVFNKTGKQLQVACVNPNLDSMKTVVQSLEQRGFNVQLFLCSEEGIGRALEVYGIGELKKIEVKTALSEDMFADVSKSERDFGKYAEKIQGLSSTEALSMIQLLAVAVGSSDVHLEPTETDAILRFRLDGILREIFHIDLKQYDQITTQVKHNAGVKINVRNIPQDGEYSFVYKERKIRVRMSTLPTEQGESIVLRILDSKSVLIDFEQLGFEKGNLSVLEKALRISYGMILVTGPTGSGKTTTLYTSLRHMNSSENKVITLEDPMEYELSGIVQSEVHPDEGYTFDTGLKALLRQDPDIIMIGEIRDLSSAETAAQSALTGHVVLSTLHTNSALESIPRLLDMGVKPFVLAPALHTVMAQRLVRVLCDKCKVERDITESEKAEISQHIERIQKIRPQESYQIPARVFDSKGCDECHHTGFVGRSAVTEIITLDDELKIMISSGARIEEIQKKVTEERDMLFMKENGIIKVIEGKTTLTEILRAVGA